MAAQKKTRKLRVDPSHTGKLNITQRSVVKVKMSGSGLSLSGVNYATQGISEACKSCQNVWYLIKLYVKETCHKQQGTWLGKPQYCVLGLSSQEQSI